MTDEHSSKDGRQRTVGSVADYIKQIIQLEQDANLTSSEKLLYRGENRLYPTTLPGLYRDPNYIKYEDRLLTEMRPLRPERFNAGTPFISTLARLQHHGLPTRTLDLTGNALIALYFSCEDGSQTISNKSNATVNSSVNQTDPNAGRVLIFRGNSRPESAQPGTAVDDDWDQFTTPQHRPSLKTVASDTVAITANLARLDLDHKALLFNAFRRTMPHGFRPFTCCQSQHQSFPKMRPLPVQPNQVADPLNQRLTDLQQQYDLAFTAIGQLSSGQLKHWRQRFNAEADVIYLIHEIQRDCPNYNHQLIPLDLYRDTIVRLDQNDPRITRQDGYLLLCGDLFTVVNHQDTRDPNSDKFQWAQAEITFRIDQLRLHLPTTSSDAKPAAIDLLIPDKLKPTILQELAVLGISEATVYPDIDHQAHTVRELVSRWDKSIEK